MDKKSVSILLSSLLLGSVSIAADVAVLAGTGGNNGSSSTVIANGSGKFQIENYDKTEIIRTMQKRSSEDREIVIQKLNLVNELFSDLYNSQLENGLIHFSNLSRKSQSTSAFDFQTALSVYEKQKIDFSNELASIVAYTKAFTQPDQKTDPIAYQAYGQVNFDGITSHYMNQLQNLEIYLSNLRQLIQVEDGSTQVIMENSGKGLSLESLEGALISTAKIKEIQEQIRQWRNWSAEDEDILMNYSLFAQGTLVQFATTYGSEERFRFLNNSYGKEREDFEQSLNEIFHIMWVRSFARLQTGLPIGTFATLWDKAKFNLDIFRDPKKLVTFTDPIGFDSDLNRDYIRQGDAYFNAIQSAQSQGYGIGNIFNGEVGVIDSVNSLAAIFSGKKPQVEVSKTILELLARDLWEERTLSTQGDLRVLLETYKKSYFDTSEREEKYRSEARNLMKLVNPSMTDDEDDNGFGSSPKFGATNTSRGQEIQLFQLLDRKIVEVERANVQDKALQELMRMDKNKTQKSRNKRGSALM